MTIRAHRPGLLASLTVGLVAALLGAAHATAATAVAPVSTTPPTISGTAQVGQTLTAGEGTWNNAPTSYAYQWLRCNRDGKNCKNIGKATQKTYVLVRGDADHTIRVNVTAKNADGSATAQSGQTAVVAAAPAASGAPVSTSPPVTSGTARAGETMATSDGKWSNKPTGFTYAWQRCSGDVASCANIAGATKKTFTVPAALVGSRLRVTVTAKNAKGTASASSALTAVVVGARVVNKRPTIGILSIRFAGPTIYARFRVCDDSRKNLTILARDSRPGVASYARRFTTLVAPKPCGVYTRHWVLPARFRGHGKYTVTLRATDKSGLTSLPASRTFNR